MKNIYTRNESLFDVYKGKVFFVNTAGEVAIVNGIHCCQSIH